MQTDLIGEARRQAEICNACHYCEGFCAVFPALHANRAFSDGDITHLANLCHNCRGCYYACQYTAPHEFNLNLPRALADVRHDGWEAFAWPGGLARGFQRSGVAIALASVLGFAILFLAILGLPGEGDGYYAALSHGAMVAIFLPAFLLPLASVAVSLRRYWRFTGGGSVTSAAFEGAFGSAALMTNLAGGHGEGRNQEDADRLMLARRWAHQAVFWGFLLCFLSTTSGSVLHYVFDRPAPYPFWSLPKLLGIPGGLMMVFGCVWLLDLKRKADPALGAASVRGGEVAFLLLLLLVAASGLLLYTLGGTALMPLLLALHLGMVLTFFLMTPYTKMVHGFYRMAALLRHHG